MKKNGFIQNCIRDLTNKTFSPKLIERVYELEIFFSNAI